MAPSTSTWSSGSTWTSSPWREAGNSLQKAHFVESVLACPSGQQGVAAMPPKPPDGRKVESGPAGAPSAADRHERARDYLSPGEVARLLDAAKAGRHGGRDHLLLLMTYRHGLRVSEAVGLRRDELDLDRARLWVRRLKGGLSVEQPIAGDELRAVRRHLATRADALPWLFVSERGQPLTRQAVNYLVAAAARRAGLPGVHPHTLRHSCGFALADKGHDLRLIQDYLGHRDPRHTVHYTRTAGRRFEGLWGR
jgi:type 1 fimbriae regulatory protein FimB